MFMVQMNLTSFDGDLVGTASRANILHYRSRLHRALRTLLLSPLLIAEYQHEQQRLSTELFSGYLVHEVGSGGAWRSTGCFGTAGCCGETASLLQVGLFTRTRVGRS